MDNLLPYQIPLGILAGAIGLYFVVRAWKFGVMRPIVSALSLGAGAVAGVWAFKNAKRILVALTFEPEPLSTFVFGAFVAVSVFAILRKIGHSIVETVFDPDSALGKWFAGPRGAILSLLPAAIVVLVLASGIRIWGTVLDLKRLNTMVDMHSHGRADYPAAPYLSRLRRPIEDVPRAAEFLDAYDPVSARAHRNLVALLLISRNYDIYLKLRKSRADVNGIYNDPQVASLLERSDIAGLLETGDAWKQLRHPGIRSVAASPELEGKLSALDLDALVAEAIPGNPPG